MPDSRTDEYPVDEFDVDYPPGARRGAHRTATPVVLEQLPYLLAALAVVVVVVLVVVYLTGGGNPTAPLGGPSTDPAATEPAATDPAATDPAATTSAPPATSEPPAPTADRALPLVVLNGTGASGLAGRVRDELTGLGWTVGEVGNADGDPLAQTVVRYSAPEHEATAAAVATDLGVQAELDEGASAPVVVVVGQDRE
ncbi:hypothetical protein GCM10028777_14910 [Angustibacter speluncae]